MTGDSRSQPRPTELRQHTPTPWAVMGNRGDIKSACKGFPETMVAKALGQPTRDERAANAAFIVEAVNSHASLRARVEELEKALGQIAEMSITPDTGASTAMAMRRLAVAALNTGEGG